MNIAKILKNAPKGTELYSTIFGPVYLVEVDDLDEYPIHTVLNLQNLNGAVHIFTSDGRYVRKGDGECVLFPSKENRDWANCKIKTTVHFNPGDKVVVKDEIHGVWTLDIFCFFDERRYANEAYPYACIGGYYNTCYEFNEQTAKMIGASIK